MSQTIWTQCGGLTNARPLTVDAWRVVEHQHTNSTRKLVDTDDEQAVLEDMIDTAKPPRPDFDGLHFLLFTPFRHPPLWYGSRFGTRQQRGLFYAAKELETALAEWAYYRFVFIEGTEANLGITTQPLTAFTASIEARVAIDLTNQPFDAHRGRISSPTSYADSQPLGTEMREAGVEACAFFSARRPDGTNYALFEPAFGAADPRHEENWTCTFARPFVQMRRTALLEDRTIAFPRDAFEIDGTLAVVR